MSGDNRSVHTDALATLGSVIGESEARDAIHLAVEPVTAGQKLAPGEDVGFLPDGTVGRVDNPVGIVDPFLRGVVHPEQRFWLVVYPRQITSLRHVWEHPAFPASADLTGAPVVSDKSASERWMRAWAVKHMSEDHYGDYDRPLPEETAYGYAIQAGHNLSVGPYEDAREHIDSRWWDHWEAITGEPGVRDEYFSCGC